MNRKTSAQQPTVRSFKPLGKKVGIVRANAEDKTSGGIFIPDVAKDKVQEGVVESVGPEVETLKVGDTVVFGAYPREVEFDGRKVVILDVDEIFGVLE
jgi:chaperonin GroES